MIDTAMYKQLDAGDTERPEPENDLDQQTMESEKPPADPFILLLPATIRGYGLHDKKWSKSIPFRFKPTRQP